MKQTFCRFGLASMLALCILLSLIVPPVQAAEPAFSDVPETHWAADSIARATELGIFQGTDGTFRPDAPITRSAFIVALNRLFDWEPVTPATGSFSDVQDTSAWYYSAVETALAHGALTTQTDTFRPTAAMTREEAGVTIIRALGLGSIAGLVQELEFPFTDVTSSPGYLSMAYSLGILKGTSDTAMDPDAAATRAQAAVLFMRVYDSLHNRDLSLSGSLSSLSKTPDLHGCSTVAVPGGKLFSSQTGPGLSVPESEETAAICTAIRRSGAKALLAITGTEETLPTDTPDLERLSRTIAAAADGFDGIRLDISGVHAQGRDSLTALVQSVRSALGSGKLLHVVVEAPAWHGTQYDGYDFAALAEQADLLPVRVAAYRSETDGVLLAPPEPLEEVYYALTKLQDSVDSDHLALLLTTTVSDGSGQETLAGLMETESLTPHRSVRYDTAYLAPEDGDLLWYHDAQSAGTRATLCTLLGIHDLVLSDLSALYDYGPDALLHGLEE